ncbi:putative ABC-type transport system, permease component [Vibrio nigripulchritudo SOn1]|uniref:ABC-type transport system, permease component n=1 Tax=Vibrio nigripulchritudo SOn1 TaxID=1238450 RepID=A0AAV2VXT6_9VIBR|nr:carbohydrate ABC transporter permease [Vibrio nigripulchritudo]CCO49178.1 putative ABC-type transport system, permease component [Vibrio nigripulchritudo SOn1]
MNTKRITLLGCQLVLALVILLPIFWMVSVSLKPSTEAFAIPAKLWPDSPTLENYSNAFRPEFRQYFLNSVIISMSTLLISTSLALMAAYAFTRFQLRIMAAFLGLILVSQMFPSSAIIIPIYKMMDDAGLLNTRLSLVIAYITITLPVATWMLKGFMENIPSVLDEAAAMDGAKPLRTFLEIVLPLCRPGVIATSVYILIVTWQEFLFALSFTTTQEMRTLPVGMNDFIGQYGIRYGELMASSVMISLPVVVVFFFLQKHFVAGLTAGSVKG